MTVARQARTKIVFILLVGWLGWWLEWFSLSTDVFRLVSLLLNSPGIGRKTNREFSFKTRHLFGFPMLVIGKFQQMRSYQINIEQCQKDLKKHLRSEGKMHHQNIYLHISFLTYVLSQSTSLHKDIQKMLLRATGAS